jgi:integrase
MTVRIERRGDRLVADIRVKTPQGRLRERASVPGEIRSESAAKRWAEERAFHLAKNGKDAEPAPATPTLKEFSGRWIREYAHANRNKPSTIAAKETILRLHLLPVLGAVGLDRIGDAEIQRVKLHLAGKAPKTLVCVLSVLQTMLRSAERWDLVERAPSFDMPRTSLTEMEFYDFAEWEALIDGAKRAGPMVRAAVLLGGDAGLRRGELVALEQSDINHNAVTVQRSEWEGKVGTTKGGKSRRIPLTSRLAEAIAEVRHLRGKRLLWQTNGRKVQVTTLQSWLETACRRAGLPESRNLHKLRHTFCSHLAMRGAPVKAIQELAGHADLKTTLRYMHLSPGSREAAIALLENAPAGAKERSR